MWGAMPYGWKNYRNDLDRQHARTVEEAAAVRHAARCELDAAELRLYEALVAALDAGCHQGFMGQSARLSRHQLRHLLDRGGF